MTPVRAPVAHAIADRIVGVTSRCDGQPRCLRTLKRALSLLDSGERRVAAVTLTAAMPRAAEALLLAAACQRRRAVRVHSVDAVAGDPVEQLNPWDFYSVPVPALFVAPDPTTVFRDDIIGASDAEAVFAYFKVGAKLGIPA